MYSHANILYSSSETTDKYSERDTSPCTSSNADSVLTLGKLQILSFTSRGTWERTASLEQVLQIKELRVDRGCCSKIEGTTIKGNER